MILLLLDLSSFEIHRFCSKIVREIFRENGMPGEQIKYFLNGRNI
jgi:hypothetical protein